MESRTTVDYTGQLCSVTMTIIPTLNAQRRRASGEYGGSASQGNEKAAKSSEAPAKVGLVKGSIVMDNATFLNRVVRIHPPIGVGWTN